MNLDALELEAERRPNDPAVWWRLGAALTRRARGGNDASDRMAAVAALMHASTIASDPELMGNIASALAELGEVSLAYSTLVRAGAVATAAPYEKVARLLIDKGRADDAATLLQQAGALVQTDEGLHLLAILLLSTEDVDAALVELDVVIAQRPGVGAYLLKAQLLAKQGRAAECIDSWMIANELVPDDPSTLTGLGVALAADQRFDEAIGALERVIALAPRSVDAQLNLAVVLREAKQFARAERVATRALELAPGSAQACYDLGLILEAAGRNDDALHAFREAISRQATWVRPLAAVARVLERSGRLDDAAEALRRASRLAQDGPMRREIAEALERLQARTAQHAFAGRLGAFSMWQVLELLQNHRSTGRLDVTLKDAKAVVFVRNGYLVRIVSDLVPRLADVIEQHCGRELPASIAVQTRASDAQLARQLTSLGLFDGPQLQSAAAIQVQLALERFIDARDGAFRFEEQAIDIRPTDVELDIRYVLLEIAEARDVANR